MKPEVVCNVLRHSPLSEPFQWAEGDFVKVWPDGKTESATFEDYCLDRGMIPAPPNVKVSPA